MYSYIDIKLMCDTELARIVITIVHVGMYYIDAYMFIEFILFPSGFCVARMTYCI